MEQYSWENIWPLDMEIDKDLLESMCCEDDEFLGDYMAQQQSSIVAGDATTAATEIAGSSHESPELLPRTCTFSFDNSTSSNSKPPCYPKKKTSSNLNLEPKAIIGTELLAGEKNNTIRSSKSTKTLFHTMAERKRRQELALKFTELSAIIPHSKKTDKTSIVLRTINYVEQLQKRVMELEVQQKKRGKEPIILNKANPHAIIHNELLPDVKVKVLEKDILIYINCEKENDIQLKILDMLQNLHLFVTATSVLTFGNSTLGITIIARMSDAYRMTMMDLVNNIRQLLVSGANHRT